VQDHELPGLIKGPSLDQRANSSAHAIAIVYVYASQSRAYGRHLTKLVAGQSTLLRSLGKLSDKVRLVLPSVPVDIETA
jgi:hypothetical protein